MKLQAGAVGAWFLLNAVTSMVGCGVAETALDVDLALVNEGAATCSTWDAAWSEGAGSNAWWIEYAITGGTVTAASLEVPGRGTVPLTFMWNKWVGLASFPIATGETVIAHATNALGQPAQTLPFAYRVDHAPRVAPCTTCSDWSPSWAQGSGANPWWVEFAVTSSAGEGITAVSFEANGRSVELAFRWGKWVGSTGIQIPRGTQAVLRADSAAGRTAQTKPFAYLADQAPVTDACSSGEECLLEAGLVTLTFDDGWAAQYTLARQPLLDHGVRGTFYIVTRAVAEHWSGFLDTAQLRQLANDGNEIGSHTVDHARIETSTDPQLDYQLAESKRWLEANITSPIRQFASPFGVINDRLVSAAKRYYQSYRSTMPGLNFAGDDPYALKADGVLSTTTVDAVRGLLDETRARKGWRILLFHDFTSGVSSDPYVYRAADFAAVLNAIAASGLETVTLGEGLERIKCP